VKDDALVKAAHEKYHATQFMTTKSELVDFYKDTYGAKAWTSHAAMDLAGTSDKKSKEYKSAIRNFQGDRITKGETAPRWQTVGQNLPPIRESNITLTVTGKQGNRTRSFTTTLTGPAADAFVDDPDYQDLFDTYVPEFGDDGSSHLDVTGVA